MSSHHHHPTHLHDQQQAEIVSADEIIEETSAEHTTYKTGYWLAFLCTIHCLAVPVIAIFLPHLTKLQAGLEWLEWAFIILSVVFIFWRVVPEYRSHRKIIFLVTASIGLCLLALSDVLFAHPVSLVISLTGSVMMGGSFYLSHQELHKHLHQAGVPHRH